MTKNSLFILLLIVLSLASCNSGHRELNIPDTGQVSCDLDSIRRKGKLVAVTSFNSTDYFIFRGEPMGFRYELLKAFSDHLGVDIEIIADDNPAHAAEMLRKGEADLVTLGIDTNSVYCKDFLFSRPVEETALVLVQRKKDFHTSSPLSTEVEFVNTSKALAGKTVYIQGTSRIKGMLADIEKETGDTINIVEVPLDQEQIMKHVADGEIDYTVCNKNRALVNAKNIEGLDVSVELTSPLNLSWAIRKYHSEQLAGELNRWIFAFRMSDSYNILYSKYFYNQKTESILKSDYYANNTGRVSPYDDIIRKYSTIIKWDWRLLASLIFQESRFRPDVRSHSGAYGLMQIMPVTGRNFGIDITLSPENNIRAGIKYINWLYSIFEPKIPDQAERLNFILAAYNAGPGHILDAMNLAEKNGMNPYKWKGNVELWLARKSDPKYYKDDVVKNGFYKGQESVSFVNEVLGRYGHYKNVIPAGKLK